VNVAVNHQESHDRFVINCVSFEKWPIGEKCSSWGDKSEKTLFYISKHFLNYPELYHHHQKFYSPLVGPWRHLQFCKRFIQTVGLLGLVISPSQGRYLHTGQQKQKKRTHRHSCLEWDSNPRSRGSSKLRQFIV
jgi:hypothetical protein